MHYADIPYQPDFPGCGTDSVNSGTQGQNDGTSETVAHEIGETQTDPDTRTGWFDPYGNETGDYCAYIDLRNVTFSSGTFAIQPDSGATPPTDAPSTTPRAESPGNG